MTRSGKDNQQSSKKKNRICFSNCRQFLPKKRTTICESEQRRKAVANEHIKKRKKNTEEQLMNLVFSQCCPHFWDLRDWDGGCYRVKRKK